MRANAVDQPSHGRRHVHRLEFELRMAAREDAEEFVGKAMADVFDTREIELRVAELLQAQRRAPGLGARIERMARRGEELQRHDRPFERVALAIAAVRAQHVVERDRGVQRDAGVVRCPR